ncbi:MAG: hypothetical protein IJN39_06880, partial [Clostridia bacterium]|nr:hypothetical protein [Clostridia bacterium]
MLNLFPRPVLVQEKKGEFVFDGKMYFIIDESFSNDEFLKLCPVLWNNFTAGKSELEIVKKSGISEIAVISSSKDDLPPAGKAEYEYELSCDENGVSFLYNCENGLIHAFSTLLQLISPFRRKTKDFAWPFCGNTNDDIRYGHDGLTDDMYIVDWQYNIKEDKPESVEYFLKFKDPSKLILAPWTGRAGIKGRCNLAKKHGCFGVMGTTWNTVYNEINDMLYTAICMWDKDDSP